jgi:hypothetical protein
MMRRMDSTAYSKTNNPKKQRTIRREKKGAHWWFKENMTRLFQCPIK